MVALTLARVLKDIEIQKASVRNIRRWNKKMMPARLARPRDRVLEQEASDTVSKCLEQPGSWRRLWKLFCLTALTNQFKDYQAEAVRLKSTFDETLAAMERTQQLVTNLDDEGHSIKNVDALDHAVKELQQMRQQVFEHWPVAREWLLQVGPSVLPPWLMEAMEAIQRLPNLPENWDSYGARRIDSATADKAFNLLADIVQSDTPRPAIVPTARGLVQFEWHVGDADLEIEFQSPDELLVSYENRRTNREWEDRLSPTDTERLVDAVATLSGQ